ncbi:MAG: hypothetical protein IEMM0008_0091 [bacterium]|nr:MAG: hypothetical protein IEMM0008_0091 [bacterium]
MKELSVYEEGEHELEQVILSAMPEMTLPDIEMNLTAIAKNQMEQRIRMGALFVQARKLFDYKLDEFYSWAEKTFALKSRTVREYILFGIYGYANIEEAKELSTSQFRKLLQLSDDVKKKVLDDWKLEGRPVKDWSAKDLENYKEKAEAEKKALKMKLKEEKDRTDRLDGIIKEGRERVEDLEKENYRLANPDNLKEEAFRRAQELIDDAVLSIRKAISVEVQKEHAPTLLSPLTVAMTDLQKEWSPKWENSQE